MGWICAWIVWCKVKNMDLMCVTSMDMDPPLKITGGTRCVGYLKLPPFWTGSKWLNDATQLFKIVSNKLIVQSISEESTYHCFKKKVTLIIKQCGFICARIWTGSKQTLLFYPVDLFIMYSWYCNNYTLVYRCDNEFSIHLDSVIIQQQQYTL